MDGAGYTLLVPTDEAFNKLSKGTVNHLKKNRPSSTASIKAHVVLGSNNVSRLSNFRTAPTADGKEVAVKVQENDIGRGQPCETDLKASNGYVHVIDKVLTLSKK